MGRVRAPQHQSHQAGHGSLLSQLPSGVPSAPSAGVIGTPQRRIAPPKSPKSSPSVSCVPTSVPSPLMWAFGANINSRLRMRGPWKWSDAEKIVKGVM